MSQFFIDITTGKCEYLSEKEIKEHMETIEPIAPMIQETEEEAKRKIEEQYILKTRMTLQEEELYTSFVQEFEYDDYHKDNLDVPSELERQVRRLKRRYPDFGEYQSAMSIYCEYMSYLYSKYGGKEIFELKDKGGFIKDYVPPMPKIKANSLNKELLKGGIVISGKSKDDNFMQIEDLDYDDILDYTNTEDAYTGYAEYDRIKEAKPNKSFDKFMDKEVLPGMSKFSNRSRAMLLRTANSLDYLDEYFKTQNRFKNEEKELDSDELNLTALINDDFITEEDLNKDEDERVYINGRILPKEQADELAAYNKLRELGWDVNKIMRRNGQVSETDIVYRKLKQIDKKEKKKKKKGKKSKDNFLSSLSFDNGSYDDFEEFAKDMFNFTADNIFKD